MLKNLVIFALCIVAIKASSLHIVKSPDSLEWKGDEKLDCQSMGDAISSALGSYADDDINWSGLYTINPFELPGHAVVLIVNGIDQLNPNSKGKTYRLVGNCAGESINAVSSDFESYNITTINFDLDNNLSDGSETMVYLFGKIEALKAPVKPTNSLKPDLHSEDRDFLIKIAFIKELFNNFLTSNQQLPTLTTIFVSLEPISKAHGSKSAAMVEAQKLIAQLLEILSDAKDTLVLVVAEKQDPYRAKREAVEGESAKSLNLAAYYNEDYPVIFNIILWFMVVLGFSVLAICYAIGSMDPGRDSIIYRMTSTRMKKDN